MHKGVHKTAILVWQGGEGQIWVTTFMTGPLLVLNVIVIFKPDNSIKKKLSLWFTILVRYVGHIPVSLLVRNSGYDLKTELKVFFFFG